MAPPADPQPSLTAPAGPAAAGASPSKWAKLTDNPLLTVLGTLAVALLVFNLNRTDNRISRLEDRMDAGFASIDAKFAAQDAKIAELDAKIDEINLKLTALISALNATGEVEAALEGRLLYPDPADDETEHEQAG